MEQRFKVTMRSVTAGPNGQTLTHEATDYVAESELEDYVEDARERWQVVEVDRNEPDYGPGGAKGTYRTPNTVKARRAARNPEGK